MSTDRLSQTTNLKRRGGVTVTRTNRNVQSRGLLRPGATFRQKREAIANVNMRGQRTGRRRRLR